ncbi:MAG: hypothetical protein WC374_06330 [Phycisphaerae bacterium]|jgi:hypothetical protein
MKNKVNAADLPKFKTITFHAIISPSAAAIDCHGEEGAKLKLEIDDSHIAEFLPIVFFRNKRLLVTITEDA